MRNEEPSGGSTSPKSRRIASNSLLLFVRMMIIMVINLYAVRLLLRGLGHDDYGTFNAVAGVVLASSFLNVTLATSIQRFYSYALGEGRRGQLSAIFSASMNIIAVLCVVLLIGFETVGVWFVNAEMAVPPERIAAANWVFQFSTGTLLLGLLQLPFTAAIFAHEEMGLFALISLVECLLRLGVVLLIGAMPFDGLAFYGGGLWAVALIVFSCYAITARRRYAECRYQRVSEPGLYRQLLSFSGWTLYSSLAGIGVMQGTGILLYMFFGPLATAAFAIAQQVLHAFSALGNSVVVAFRPAMVKAYAEKSYAFLDRLFAASNKFILYLMLLVTIPLILELRTIFAWWLDEVSEETVVYTRLIMVYMVCLTLNSPVTTIVQSTGRLKYYSLCVDSLLLMQIPAMWIAFRLGAPSESCMVLLVATCLAAHVIRLVVLRRLYPRFRYATYLAAFVVPGAAVALCTALPCTALHHAMEPGLLRTAAVFAASAAAMLPSVYALGLSKDERRIAHDFIAARMRR